MRRITVSKADFAYPAQMAMLVAGGCPALLPVEIVEVEAAENGAAVDLFYQVSDRRALSSIPDFSVRSALETVQAVLAMMEELRRWLWFPESYLLTLDTVYLTGDRRACLAFVPDAQCGCEQEKLRTFLRALGTRTDAEGLRYLQIVEEEIAQEDMRCGKLMAWLDELLAEVRALGLP